MLTMLESIRSGFLFNLLLMSEVVRPAIFSSINNGIAFFTSSEITRNVRRKFVTALTMCFSRIYGWNGITPKNILYKRRKDEMPWITATRIAANNMIYLWDVSAISSWKRTNPPSIQKPMRGLVFSMKPYNSVPRRSFISSPIPALSYWIDFYFVKNSVYFSSGQGMNYEVLLVSHDRTSYQGSIVARAGMALQRCLGSIILREAYETCNN